MTRSLTEAEQATLDGLQKDGYAGLVTGQFGDWYEDDGVEPVPDTIAYAYMCWWVKRELGEKLQKVSRNTYGEWLATVIGNGNRLKQCKATDELAALIAAREAK